MAKTVIITDETVKDLYGHVMANEIGAEMIAIQPGEASKSREMKANIEDALLELGCGRDTKIIALGGGVVGDLAGFVAATFMRGVPYIQIPTTMLAMVDSSIGGKTGINVKAGKNLIGAFWQPEEVIVDIKYLQTLPQEHFVNGLIEAIKMYLTHDAKTFKFVEENLEKILNKDEEVLKHVIEKARVIKTGIVKRDERESNERMMLNFGHTIGHALEKLSNYELLHGQAVALGILVEIDLANLDADFKQRIQALFEKLKITKNQITWSEEEIWNAMSSDKKNKDGKIRYVKLTESECYIEELNRDTLKSVIN